MGNYFRFLRAISVQPMLVTLLAILVVLWTLGISTFYTRANAATVSFISATASSSAPSANTNYTIQWTATTSVTVGQTIKISFDPGNSTFDLGSLTTADVVSQRDPRGGSFRTHPPQCCGRVPIGGRRQLVLEIQVMETTLAIPAGVAITPLLFDLLPPLDGLWHLLWAPRAIMAESDRSPPCARCRGDCPRA